MDKRKPFRSTNAFDVAEAVFKPAPAKVAAPPAAPPAIPGARELVSLRIDQDVLASFQADGQGWQERMNQALRKAAGL
jgi:uncharacterized protein (DUF4415 family)